MQSPKPKKPHIYFYHGYWRVTLVPPGTKPGSVTMKKFNDAHTFAVKLNSRILISQRGLYRNRHNA